MNLAPLCVCLAGFAIVLISAQIGVRQSAYLALCGTLGVVLAAAVALRYWFVASRFIGIHEEMPKTIHFVVVFWVMFILAGYVFATLRHRYTEVFESGFPSLLGRLLGGLLGLVRGVVIMALVVMTATIILPRFWPAYLPGQLPVPVDRWPVQAYRFIETQVAGIGPAEQGHTPLPSLDGKKPIVAAGFWQ
jgi:hypothetical protein